VPPEYFQALAFAGQPLPAGTVRYHEAFAATADLNNGEDTNRQARSGLT